MRLIKIWGLQTLFLSTVNKILEHHAKIKPALFSLGEGWKAGPTFPSPCNPSPSSLKPLNVDISEGHSF